MFDLLVSTLARMSLNKYSGKDLAEMNKLMEAMFNTCQQQQLEGTQAPLQHALSFTRTFSSPDVNDEVVKRWKEYPGYTKVKSLIQKVDNLWNTDNRMKLIAKQRAWESVKGKFLIAGQREGGTPYRTESR